MSRNISAGLLARLAMYETTMVRCWKLTLNDGTVIRVTDHDRPVEVAGEEYGVNSAYTVTALDSTANMASDNAEAQVLLAANGISKEDILAGKYDGARLNVFLVDWSNTADGVVNLPGGYLGQVGVQDGIGMFEIRGLTALLAQPIGRDVLPTCDANVGDARCGVDIGPFTVTGSVTSPPASAYSAYDSTRVEADAYFAYSVLTWTGGDNAGTSIEIKLFESGTFTFFDVTPYPVQVGDTYSVHRGCNRLFDTCKDVFSNAERFRGFPHLPGQREILSGPDY